MKLVLFQVGGTGEVLPGLLTDRGVVSIADVVKKSYTPQLTMNGVIEDFEKLRPALERAAASGEAKPLSAVQLRAPLPRPGKILACIANYWEHAQRAPRKLAMFLKNPDAVIGPGDTVVLPEFTEPYAFMHEAELAIVIKGPAKMVKRENWRSAVFGYTGIIDVSARGEGPRPGPASRSTPSRRSAHASPPPTRFRSRTISSSGSGTTASCGTTTIPTIWSIASPSSSNGRPRS
jgi:2-keto-4-pentenoate hydratase/2-oxohepta-3-ene-1,7-dioic acid hydratase in catechol pathway